MFLAPGDPCRERKRRCDGNKPCELCTSFDYECHYRSQPRKRRNTGRDVKATDRVSTSPGNATLAKRNDVEASEDGGSFAKTLESNSGSAFVRSFALAVDPTTTSTPTFGTFQMLAWNLFLGERYLQLSVQTQSITELLSLNEMQDLISVYFEKMDPCYGFLVKEEIEAAVHHRWTAHSGVIFEAILCGVAAIGCLFSHLKDLQTEVDLFSLMKACLDSTVSEPPSVESATAWLLRTVYLRLTARPDEAWLSSCTTLHHIDGAGLHSLPNANAAFQRPGWHCDADTRRRIFGVARHLNSWLSFDLGRSRVLLQNASLALPTNHPPGDYTIELLELLPYVENLDPGRSITGEGLLTAFSEVLNRTHSQSPSVCGQCNLMLCLYRRLYTLRWKIPGDILEQAVSLIEIGLQAVLQTVEEYAPWHNAPNVAFQSLCTLLAIDTPRSFSLLSSAISCLDTLNQVYQTNATKDALSAAQALVYMHQKQREADVKRQADLLNLYPATFQPIPTETFDNFPFDQAFIDLPWFNDLIPNMDLSEFDQFIRA